MTETPNVLPAALRAPQSVETRPAGPKPHEGVRWALYARSGGGSLEQTAQQFAFMEETVARLGGTIAGHFSDLGVVGDGMAELIRAAHRGDADRVMAWSLDRFGGRTGDMTQTLTALRDLGVGVTLAGTGEDVDGAFVAATLSVAAVVAEQARRPRRRPGGGL
ncbi:recombinase family protein [Nonomuraea sp. NPDC052265]|uniref:recombinase family protein n=1 Tax=Nonomuraea sp. NPDC052265 TaxID=3364374 RepID=UPI0037C9CA15